MGPAGSRRELQVVVRRLIDEFGDQIELNTIVRVAREEVLLFDRAKVRDSVPTVAWLLARDRLRGNLERSERSPERVRFVPKPAPPQAHRVRTPSRAAG